MTVILAVRCAEGLVLATDSQATAQIAGGTPVKQEATKIHQLGDRVLFAGTGAVGCSQRVEAALNGVSTLDQFDPGEPRQLMGALIHQGANAVQKQSANSFVQYAQQAQPESWGGIFCGRSSDGLWIMEVDLNGGWQFHDDVAATGSGYALAFHAIASVQHYNVTSQSLLAAKAIAYRAIETTCIVSAFGVGLPVQMGVVLESGACLMSPDEVAEVEELVNLWKAKEVETLGAALAPSNQPGGLVTEPPAEHTPEGLRPPEGPDPEQRAALVVQAEDTEAAPSAPDTETPSDARESS